MHGTSFEFHVSDHLCLIWNPSRSVRVTEWTRNSGDGWKDGWSKNQYTPQQPRCAGGITTILWCGVIKSLHKAI